MAREITHPEIHNAEQGLLDLFQRSYWQQEVQELLGPQMGILYTDPNTHMTWVQYYSVQKKGQVLALESGGFSNLSEHLNPTQALISEAEQYPGMPFICETTLLENENLRLVDKSIGHYSFTFENGRQDQEVIIIQPPTPHYEVGSVNLY